MSRGFGKAKKTALAGVMVLALPVVGQFEGLRTKAYLDSVGIPTICWGETENVKLGDVKSKEECDHMLSLRLAYFVSHVKRLVTYPATDSQIAAYSSLAYNIGINAFEKSSVLRLANEGKKAQSCDFMLKYVYADGKKLNGLVKRRQAERELCLR